VADSLLNTARGVVYGNQASVYIKKHNYDQAKSLLKKSIAINILKSGDNNDAILSELKLARLYENQYQIDSMLPVLKVVEQQLKVIKNDEALVDLNLLMASYYEHKQQLSKAITYHKKYDELKSILTKKTSTLKATDITQQLKRFEREYEVNNLKKTNQQKNIYLIIIAAFFLMATIILLLIYLNWQKSKKLLHTLSDLNEQINSKNADLEKALDKLEVSSQEKDRILRTVAHDLRNPIGGIGSLISSVIDDENCTPEQKIYLTLVKDTAYNTLELINEILEATNDNNTEVVKQWVEINALINNSVELLRFKAAEKSQLIVFTELDAPVEVFVNSEKIWRVVSNLISNAIKFSQIGGIIKVKVTKINHTIEIAVNDQGIGIPDEIKGLIFNMFTEAKRPGTQGEKSFGLGLSICRQIMEQHQGKIWVESNKQAGTTLYIQLINCSRQIEDYRTPDQATLTK
jgi:signal transduction histidine kinase